MPIGMVQAPVSLLLDPKLTPAAKLLWLTMQAYGPTATPSQLAAGSGLTLATIRSCRIQLEAVGWAAAGAAAAGGPGDRGPGDRGPARLPATVMIPADLLAARRIRPQAKLLYGILQLTPNSEKFTYKELSQLAGLSIVTVRQTARQLARTPWLQATQVNQQAPIKFTLGTPEADRAAAELERAKVRVSVARYTGEAIMREFLSLLIDSDEYEDGARLGVLENPGTGCLLELDRYYPPRVGFEFNGAQHDRTTDRFPSKEELLAQQTRDLVKEALCGRRGIRLVVIHLEDLTLPVMQKKVGDLLPRRDLRGKEELIDFLERRARRL